jgi:penicillin-binding protein 2
MDRRDQVRFKTFTRRALVLGGLQGALATVLAGRLYWLQVVEAERWRTLSDDNRISLRMLPPPRGRVLDRTGEEIAGNRRNFRVVLIPEQTGSVRGTLEKLSRLITLDDTQKARVLREVERRRKFMAVSVADNLTWEEFARLNLHSPDLPGVLLDVGETRAYGGGATFGHIVGYVGAVATEDLRADNDPLLELPGFRVGKSGLEKAYDRTLRGAAGVSQVEVNAVGRVIRELERRDGQPGTDVVLTVDSRLQRFAASRLNGESGAAVVLDVQNGDLLSLVSHPGYDPNLFAVGISRPDWQALQQDKYKPLMNKALAGQYPPGSTFKMVVAMAALEAGVVTPDHRIMCQGHMEFGSHIFHCWKKGGHGALNLVDAIAQSCDVYFYEIARRVGVDRIAEMSRRFGLGAATGIDLPGELRGIVPTRDWRDWKSKRDGIRWAEGETLNIGIGQGVMLATPLQLAVMTARLATGRAVVPRLTRPADEVSDPVFSPLGMQQQNLRLVLDGMATVVNSNRGTAFASRIKQAGWEMAGKTGTSQVRRITMRERELGLLAKPEQRPWEERDHALFVATAPVGNPRYACAVIVEHGIGGAKVAAPIARDLMIEVQRIDPARQPVFRGRFAQTGGGGG